VAVGFSDSFVSARPLPALIVIPDGAIAETLSWLRTFAGEAYPLSQYARVISRNDWHQFGRLLNNSSDIGRNIDRWACIAVGEAISQVDGEAGLKHLPLSRLAGCFTMPIARAALVWASDEASQLCAERLQAIESDRRFVRRPVGVHQLFPAWSISIAQIEDYLTPAEAAELVMEAASHHFAHRPNGSEQPSFVLKKFPTLFGDSVEERVTAFNLLAQEVQRLSAHASQGTSESPLVSVAIAAAAFLVGRGTSHLFLLQRLQRYAPSAAAWFGVIAALSGPRSWDRAWLRAVKGAERLLRPDFNWTEPAAADICWAEFAWLSKSFDGQDVFLDLPKMLPRTLNIEVVAGATCQLRIAGETVDSTEAKREVAPSSSGHPSDRERSLEKALNQFLNLAKHAGHLLETVPPPKQRSLELDDAVSPEKAPKARKPRRYTHRT